MCGIAGWMDFDHDISARHAVTTAMTNPLACRGPDAEGRWADRHAQLGHRRLAVIDVDGGAQPMVAREDGRVVAVVTFCGEIYNFRELRDTLAAAGHRFRTSSDTEVLLRAYVQWGAAAVDRLNGMFAFAVWDPVRQELLLARDRLGVKPLFYLPTEHGVVFGSEPKAVLAHPYATRRVDAEGLCEALDMVKTPERTVFSGLFEVRPGQLVHVDARGLRKRTYWRLEAREHTADLATTTTTVRGLLTDAVARQLTADVPVCTLLSGGLDSSAITALAARALTGRRRLPSFSVGFAETGFEQDAVRAAPDTPFAHEVARFAGTDHTHVMLDSDELSAPATRTAVLRATDTPPAFWGDMWPSLYLLCRAVREHATVALSGEGADELFGGYPWYRNPRAIEADTFPWLTSGSARYFGGTSLLDRGLLEKLDIPGYRAARYAEALAEVPVLPGENVRAQRMRAVTYLNLTRFLQTLLDRKDRMSMAVGLEVRVPFCDHRLVEYVFNVPWEMRSFDGREKSLLRAAVADMLPSSVLQRVKTPYPVIQHVRYEQALRARLADLTRDPNAPVRPLLDLERTRRALDRPLRAVSQPYERGGVEMVLWLNDWLTAYDVTLDL